MIGLALGRGAVWPGSGAWRILDDASSCPHTLVPAGTAIAP
jgi:hypothetical protein